MSEPVRVWVIWSNVGFTVGVQAVALDATLSGTIRHVADVLRKAYEATGEFTRVRQPEPYYRDDERVFRNGSLTIVARPFTIDLPD